MYKYIYNSFTLHASQSALSCEMMKLLCSCVSLFIFHFLYRFRCTYPFILLAQDTHTKKLYELPNFRKRKKKLWTKLKKNACFVVLCTNIMRAFFFSLSFLHRIHHTVAMDTHIKDTENHILFIEDRCSHSIHCINDFSCCCASDPLILPL